MTGKTTQDVAAWAARQAFQAGLRAAALPPAERQRQAVAIQEMTQQMLAGHVDAEVERRLAEPAP